MSAILNDPKATRVEKIEAAKVLAACQGVLLPELSEKILNVKQVLRLREAKQKIVEQVLRKQTARKRQNRRYYIRKKLKRIGATEAVSVAAQPEQTGKNETNS